MNTKTFLITGGTTGIGLATAQHLSAQGAKVIVTGRNPETLASAKKILSDAVVLRSDSGDLPAAQALGGEIRTFADHLDGAFLNAGVGTFQPIEAATPKNYDDMFNVNVRGLYFQLQSLLPLLGNPSSVGFDAEALLNELAAGKGDGEILQWVLANAKTPRALWEIEARSAFMEKRGPDSDAETLALFAEYVGQHSQTREDIKTWFEAAELDDYANFGGKP